jgi:2-polyprenyl-3-methyl-5-hydroxy-6-metoxy-1,4-benzoquinol methylase
MDTIGHTVLDFYKALPFNQHSTPEAQIEALQRRNPVLNYPMLLPLLGTHTSVLEVGCGTGWLSNSLALHHGARVTGIDFNARAVGFASRVAEKLRLHTQFAVQDLFTYAPAQPFELVVSLGVLHHTVDCAAAVRKLCRDFVGPGGHALIGLYHRHGRKPFLDHFAALKASGASEAQQFARYRALHSQIQDDTHAESWFRDQVLHPHETQHTLAEMLPLLQETGMSLVSTSLNQFGPIDSMQGLLDSELDAYRLGLHRLEAGQYFPGFFVFLARKSAA